MSEHEERDKYRTEEAEIERLLFKQVIWRSGNPNIHRDALMVRYINQHGMDKVRTPRRFYSDPATIIEMEEALWQQSLWEPYLTELTLPRNRSCLGGRRGIGNWDLFNMVKMHPRGRASAALTMLLAREAAANSQPNHRTDCGEYIGVDENQPAGA